MSEKSLNSRIQLKNDTETNWNKATGFIPKKGEMIIYNAETANNTNKIKIGDGATTVTNLPFTLTTATENEFGLVKLNPDEFITLNADGSLNIGGRLGQMPNSSGIYAPKNINPLEIGDGSLLVTEGSGTVLGRKSLAVSTGIGITLKTPAAAGSKEYRVSNTYVNRISCAALLNAAVAVSEATADNTVHVTSVTINGANINPSSAANDSSQDIVILTDETINPDSTLAAPRFYPQGKGFSNLLIGQCVGSESTGASVIVGQRVFSKSGNACALVGADIYNTGNGNAVFGRQHISKKNRSFLAGTGHDTSSARSEGVAALGQWSDITSTTLFAIGNGTSHTQRSNIFEINDSGQMIMKDSNGTRWKISVTTNGTLDIVAA